MRDCWRIILGLAAVPLCLGVGVALFPLPHALVVPLPGTLTLLDQRGRILADLATPEARAQFPLRHRDMGAWLPRITVALEDHRFYEHHGVDWRSTAGATMRDLHARHIVSGASTITQQLVKLATDRHDRSWTSKVYEVAIAWKLERQWSKERILTEYLNRSSYGNRRLGPEAAARAYFGKHAADLTLPEAIYLAGLPQAPTRLNPWRHPEAAQRKFGRTLARLRELGVISGEQQQLLAVSAPKVQRSIAPRQAQHFTDTVVARNPQARGVLHTTLDLDLQRTAEHLLSAHLQALNRHDISEAALVVIENSTGAVRALVGSDDYAVAQVNGAMQARSCGSTLKPFVYLAALDRHMLTAATLLPDTADAIRAEYADYDPQNFSHRYLGPVRMREALACSLNVPAVYVLSQLGARASFHELAKWGFDFPRTLNDYGAGFVLGNAETRLVDLAGAYAGLARGGVALRTKFLAEEHHPQRRIASAAATAIITDVLCDNEAREKSFGTHSPLALPQRVAVKTGTSSGFRDTWTVGFDKQHTVAVWAGNFDGRPMHDILAVRAASPLWAAMMQELLKRDEPLDPPAALPQLVRQTISKTTGMLPSSATHDLTDELFLSGSQPTQSSADSFDENGALILPDQYAGWCASSANTIGAKVRSPARITNPPANARYQIDSVLPATQQMVELTATMRSDARWFINGQPQPRREDGRVFWQLAPGQWKISAIAPTGTAEEQITVE